MTPSAQLKVLDWNVNAFTPGRFDEKLDLIERLDWDVATLQELLPGTMQQLCERFPDCTLVTRDPNEVFPRPWVCRRCGVLVRPSVRFVEETIIDCDGDQGFPGVTSPAPREVLVAAVVDVGGRIVTVVSAHPPHAAGQDDTEREWRVLGKVRTYAALNEWITTRQNVIVGMDANAWLDEHPFEQASWDDNYAQASVMRFFFSEPPEHGLRDAFRVWLHDHPAELAEIKRRRPHGPLALTYVRGGNTPIADRFDVIMMSSSFVVETIEHNYEDAVAAGSDHAYVLAQLSARR